MTSEQPNYSNLGELLDGGLGHELAERLGDVLGHLLLVLLDLLQQIGDGDLGSQRLLQQRRPSVQ